MSADSRDLTGSPGSSSPLELAGKEPFGIGGRRLCFVHPTEPSKCVKVLRQDPARTVRLKKRRLVPARFRREYDNNAHEQKVLEDLERRIGPAVGQHLPRSYGSTATDLGPGLVLDLVRDHDGDISKTIRQLITEGHDLSSLRGAFDALGDFLLRHRILTRKLLDHNIVAKMDAGGAVTLYIIDGLGDPAWLPFSRWIPKLARSRIRRNLTQAWLRFEAFAATGGVTREMIDKSTWGQGILNHRGR